MDILNKRIGSLCFDDIAKFCEQGYGEGIQLDYKREIPAAKTLAKHFAAFSNTRGGLIIIGVSENEKNGTPAAWEGVKNEGKLEERINQIAANVAPLPLYDIHITDEKEGKVFVLIRIFEGDQTPYYVQNDANLWVRTGNISSLIDIASPDAAEILFLKREKAELARINMIQMANEVYKSALLRAEKERLALIASEKNKGVSDGATKVYSKTLGTETSLCIVSVQPFYPSRAFTTPQELKPPLESIFTSRPWNEDFPPINMESIPEGLLNFDWKYYSGFIQCSQFYAKGLIYHLVDVLHSDEKGRKIWIAQVADILFMVLKTAGNLYHSLGYQGGLSGNLLLKNVQDATLVSIGSDDGWVFESDYKKGLLPTYTWELKLDTTLLNNKKEFQSYYIETLKEIHWSLGYSSYSKKEELIKAFLKKRRWLVP